MNNNIKEICKAKEISISKLARAAELSRSHVNKIIDGETTPTIKNARKISNVLGATLEEVFPEDKEVSYEN